MRTLFGKQLLLYLGILIISFIILGAVLSQIIRNYMINQRIASLADSAVRITRSMEAGAANGIFNMLLLRNQAQNIYQYLNAHVVVIDTDYRVIIMPDYLEESALGSIVYSKDLEPLMEGSSVVVIGNVNNVYSENLLTVGYPLTWNFTSPAGAVLVSVSMAELEAAIFDMYRAALICLLFTGFFASLLIYISCRAISKPLRQMNEAARVIAGGDFEKRITVSSRDEVGQLARQFNTMAEGLQEQEKIRRAFIANLSHDLRSPLTSMRGFLQALSDGTAGAEQQPYYLNIILDESERLIKLSNDILDMHRIQDMEIKVAKTLFDINALIRKTIMGFEKRALDKQLFIDCRFAGEEGWVWADEGMIQRVIYNLLDNAIKFTPELNGEIIVETTAEGRKVRISVTDNGRGISAEEQKRIFDRFYKGDPSRNEDKMGSGIGLSIVKEFIRAHGESVSVNSGPEGGCEFSFTLDTAEAPPDNELK